MRKKDKVTPYKRPLHRTLSNRDKLFNKIEGAIKKESLTCIRDICNYVAISHPTIYNNFPVGSPEMEYFVELLDNNKALTKKTLRDSWLNSNSPAERIALYKLLATPEERAALTNSNLIVTQDPLEAKVNPDEIGRVPLDVLQRYIAANMKNQTPPMPTYVDFEESGTGGESGGSSRLEAGFDDDDGDPENIED